MLRFRPEKTEKRRTEEHAGDHLRHDLGLPEAQSNAPTSGRKEG